MLIIVYDQHDVWLLGLNQAFMCRNMWNLLQVPLLFLHFPILFAS